MNEKQFEKIKEALPTIEIDMMGKHYSIELIEAPKTIHQLLDIIAQKNKQIIKEKEKNSKALKYIKENRFIYCSEAKPLREYMVGKDLIAILGGSE